MANAYVKNKTNTMKKVFGIFVIISGLMFIAPGLCDDMIETVTGTLIDEKGDPVIGANVIIKGEYTGDASDLDGKFSLSNVPTGSKITISFIGYETEEKDASADMGTITLKEASTNINEVVVTGQAEKCNKGQLKKVHATEGRYLKGQDKCVPQKCEEPYTLNRKDESDMDAKCEPKTGKCTPKQNDNVKAAEWTDVDGENICKITECTGNFKPNEKGTKCETQDGTECTHDDPNATKAKYNVIASKLTCVIKKCKDGYLPNDDGTACEVSEGECSPEQLAKIENATKGELKKGKCKATECKDGFEPSKGECKAKKEKKDKDKKDDDDGLSDEEKKKRQAELDANAKAMKEKEQSTANKMLGAVGMGATGIGAMQMMSGAAEQKADEDAEADMKAYLETFTCKFGDTRVKGGEKNIELPGANALMAQRTEYIALANDLKTRKESLGMKPGIESELILDQASTGLYDDVHTGKTGGKFTSVSRALLDKNSDDAKAWAEQKADAADKKKTGMITAAAGVGISAIGNLALNSGKNKQDKTDDILSKYKGMEKSMNDLPDETAKCPTDATGKNSPDCVCKDNAKYYNSHTNKCESCTGTGRIVKDNVCTCPDDEYYNYTTGKCEKLPKGAQCRPIDAGDRLILDTSDSSCKCNDRYTRANDTYLCSCTPGMISEDGACVSVSQKETSGENPIKILTSKLFAPGSTALSKKAEQLLKGMFDSMKDSGIKNCEITIDIYSDNIGNEAEINNLNSGRASAVAKYIEANAKDVIKGNVKKKIHKGLECQCGDVGTEIPSGKTKHNDYKYCADKAAGVVVPYNVAYAPCRRIEIYAKCEGGDALSKLLSGGGDGIMGLLGNLNGKK